jgi:indole-3-pyruvate monooxygenase
VVSYLGNYQKEFNINPVFDTEAKSIRKENDYWITETNNETCQSKYIIMATGAFDKPKPVSFKGMDIFKGRIIHSYEYTTGKDFGGQKVLVAGFGDQHAVDFYHSTGSKLKKWFTLITG